MHHSEAQAELATHLFTLFIRCPFGQAAGDCPFADIRALRNLEFKFRLAEKMARHPQCPTEVRETHGACYRKRLRTIMGPEAPATEREIHTMPPERHSGQPRTDSKIFSPGMLQQRRTEPCSKT